MTAWLDTTIPWTYCPGCGHPHVLRALDAALGELALPAGRVAVVTDIGCVGLADPYFPAAHTVHTLHGRSVAIAAGLSMADRGADRAATDGPLATVVLIGDGGAGIGLLHLVHAAQANVDVTVLVHNNLVYGMTGGQHSMLTPSAMKTTTTPEGCPLPPLNLEPILAGAGAGFFARCIAPSDELAGVIGQAIRHPGFACVEIFELCPTFATARGGVTGRSLRELPADRGLAMGILRSDTTRPVFPPPRQAATAGAGPDGGADGIIPEPAWGRLDRTARLVVAGRAGERVQSASLIAATAACAAGLQATVRTDNPVTQGTGFSLAEITVAPGPIEFTGLVEPDVAIVLAPEGVNELSSRAMLRPPGAARRHLFDAGLQGVEGIDIARADLRARYGQKGAALGALIEEVGRAGWWDGRAWLMAVGRLPVPQRTEAEAVLRKAGL